MDVRGVLGEALRLAGLGEAAAGVWVEVLVAQAVQEGGGYGLVGTVQDGAADSSVQAPTAQGLAVVAGLVAMGRGRCILDAGVLVAVQELVLRAGERLLADRGVADAGVLGKTAHRSWRAQAKAAVAGEVQVALGVGVVEARQLVAVASYPGVVRVLLLGALRRGEVDWALVRRFASRTSRLDVGQAAQVAQVLFGTDIDLVAPERLDPDGELVSRPWHRGEFYAALDREVTRLAGTDEQAAKQRRQVAHSLRNTRLDVEEEGTATLTVSGSLATMVALNTRVEGMARRCRKAGDGRTLAQLRADIVALLLLFGRVDLPGPDTQTHEDRDGRSQGAGEDGVAGPDAIITPDDVEALSAVINATPAGQVELVVPWDALLGRAVCPTCRTPVPTGGDTTGDDTTGDDENGDANSGGGGDRRDDGGRDGRDDVQLGAQSPADEPPPGHRGGRPPGRPSGLPGWVGELRGWPAGWVSAQEAREVALRPGSVFYRLLTDPADGRCIERSIPRYAPDAEMRRQVRAADVYGRGPGCRRPAVACELDHEHEWSRGGATSETNLNAKSRLDHFRKTKGLWTSVMSPRRDLTWTTLLGQVASTRGHDYRQYTTAFDRLAPQLEATDGAGAANLPGGAGDRADLAARRDLANQVLYAALVTRGPGEGLQAEDDIIGSEDWLTLGEHATLWHRDTTGARRPGPPPHPATPEDILGLTAPPGDDENRAHPDRKPGEPHQKESGPPAQPEDSHRRGTTPWAKTEQHRPDDDPPPF